MARPKTLAGYRASAFGRITDYLTTELAAVRPELVTRLAEYYFETSSEHFNIDPHVVNPVIASMIAADRLTLTRESTRGGRQIETLSLSTPPASEAQKRSAARKRLLYARYLHWTSGSHSRAGTAGPAAEAAVRTALGGVKDLAPIAAGFGPVTDVFGVPVPGPLDSAVTVSSDPTKPPVIAPIEVKNVRYWLYPNSEEPWQLIWKALSLSTRSPDWRICPVLICRRAHPSLFWMARDIGFLVREMRVSPMGDVDPTHLREVVAELGFHDLRAGSAPSRSMQPWFADTLPSEANRTADTWAITLTDPRCQLLLERLAGTRKSDDRAQRTLLLRQLNLRCRALGRQGWTRPRYSSR